MGEESNSYFSLREKERETERWSNDSIARNCETEKRKNSLFVKRMEKTKLTYILWFSRKKVLKEGKKGRR